MNKKIIFSFFALFALLPFLTFGQTGQGDTELISYVVATLSVEQAEIIFQDKDKIEVSVKFKNEKGAQSQIKYALQAIEKRGEHQFLADEKVFDEFLSISENSEISKKLIYDFPDFLFGKYQLWIVARNENGMTLAAAFIGDILRLERRDRVEIDQSSCFVRIQGEKDKKYIITQGVDIDSDEIIIGVCDVINYLEATSTFTPSYETFYRGTAGDRISQKKGEQKVFLKPLERKNVSFILPKALKPQAYDVKLTLTSESNIPSNFVLFRYVLRGQSATIQNVVLDKDYYKGGEVAKMSLNWSPSADAFSGPISENSIIGMESRKQGTKLNSLMAEIIVSNDENDKCSDIKVIDLLSSSKKESNALFFKPINIDIPIITNCLNPTASVSLKTQEGKVFDEKKFVIKTKITPRSYLSLITFLLTSSFIFWMFKKRANVRNLNSGEGRSKIYDSTLLLFFIFGSAFVPINFTRAAGMTIGASNEGKQSVYYNVNLSPSNISPQGTLTLSAFGVSAQYCPNASWGYMMWVAGPYLSNKTTLAQGGFINPATFSGSNPLSAHFYDFNAPDAPGNYYMNVSICLMKDGGGRACSPYNWLPFTVSESPPNPPTITCTTCYPFDTVRAGNYENFLLTYSNQNYIRNYLTYEFGIGNEMSNYPNNARYDLPFQITPGVDISVHESNYTDLVSSKVPGTFVSYFVRATDNRGLRSNWVRVPYRVSGFGGEAVSIEGPSEVNYRDGQGVFKARSSASFSSNVLNFLFKFPSNGWVINQTDYLPPGSLIDVPMDKYWDNFDSYPKYTYSGQMLELTAYVCPNVQAGTCSNSVTKYVFVNYPPPPPPPVICTPGASCAEGGKCGTYDNACTCVPVEGYDICSYENYEDIGLRSQETSGQPATHIWGVPISTPDSKPSPLRIQTKKGTYRIPLVLPTNSSSASKMRIKINDNVGIWALMKKPL